MGLRRRLLGKLDAALRALCLFPQRRPHIVLAGFVVALGLTGYGLTRLQLQLDMFQDLGPSFKSREAQETLAAEFGDTASVSFAFVSSKPLSLADACQIKTAIDHAVNGHADIARVLTPWSVRRPENRPDHLWYKTLLQDPCVAMDPVAPFAAELEKLRGSPWQNFFLGQAPDQVIIETSLREDFDIHTVGALIREFKTFTAERMPEVQVHVFGQLSLRWYILEILKKDSVWNIGILVFFIFFFYYFIGTWRSGLYYAGILVVSEFLLFGTMGLLGFPIDTMSNCLFLMTAIAGASDYLFVTSAQKEGGRWQDGFLAVATPSFFTSVTSFFGFLSLGVADIPMIERFGQAAALGAIFQYVSSFIVLPALLSAFKVEKAWVRSHARRQVNAGWFLKMNRYTPRPLLTLGLLALAALGPFGLGHLNVGEDMLKNFTPGHPFAESHAWLREDKGWQGQVYLLINAEVGETERQRLIQEIVALPEVKQVETAEAIKSYMTEALPPSRADLVLREMSGILMRRFTGSAGTTRVPLYTATLDVKRLNTLVAQIERLCDDKCRVGGRTVSYLESSSRISKSLIESLGASVVAVILILVTLTWLKQSPHVVAFILSSIWGPLIMLVFMWWSQWPVSSVTSIFFALIVGWTGDNAIQYMFAADDIDEGLAERASATLMQTIIFCGSSLFLLFQVLIPMQILGMLFVLGFFLTYVGDLWLLKGLIELGEKWKTRKTQKIRA